MPSLIAAIVKTKRAKEKRSFSRKITKKGVSNILKTVKILGIFMVKFDCFNAVFC